ncbi:MAG: glycosyltransferase family 2 protein, partial [Clostridia bacterium]
MDIRKTSSIGKKDSSSQKTSEKWAQQDVNKEKKGGITVSVIIPVFCEEGYIAQCLDSLLSQDYPRNDMEWLVIDGMSGDGTMEVLREYERAYSSLISIYLNENRTVPYAMNIGIKHARGKYIIRVDAHAGYAHDYISKCVHYLNTTDADNVGGVATTIAKSKTGAATAKMLSSKFGVGNSQFRTSGHDGYVDTVPFGAFRRSVFEKLGDYDVRLTRNQDNVMNYRIRKNGGKIYMSNDIKLTYYCRDSIDGVLSMAFQNGLWNPITMKLCPGSMGIRHFVPMAFVLSLVIL